MSYTKDQAYEQAEKKRLAVKRERFSNCVAAIEDEIVSAVEDGEFSINSRSISEEDAEELIAFFIGRGFKVERGQRTICHYCSLETSKVPCLIIDWSEKPCHS